MNAIEEFRKAASLYNTNHELVKHLDSIGLNKFELECLGLEVEGHFLQRYGYNILEEDCIPPIFGHIQETRDALSYFVSLDELESKLAEESDELRAFLLKVQEGELRMTENQRFGIIGCICSEFHRRGEPAYLN